MQLGEQLAAPAVALALVAASSADAAVTRGAALARLGHGDRRAARRRPRPRRRTASAPSTVQAKPLAVGLGGVGAVGAPRSSTVEPAAAQLEARVAASARRRRAAAAARRPRRRRGAGPRCRRWSGRSARPGSAAVEPQRRRRTRRRPGHAAPRPTLVGDGLVGCHWRRQLVTSLVESCSAAGLGQVPADDDGHAVLRRRARRRCGAEQRDWLRRVHGQADPARAEHAADVPVRDEHHRPVGERVGGAGQHPIGARGRPASARLAAGHAVRSRASSPGSRLADLGGGEALVVAVVPLGEVVVDRRRRAARPARRCRERARARAGQHEGRAAARASTARSAARLRPRRASVSGMSVRPVCWPVAAPLGLAVADQPQRGTVVGHGRAADEGRPRIGSRPSTVVMAATSRAQAAFLVSQKILSISAIRSSSFWPSAGSTAPLPPAAPAALVALLNSSCSCGYFSKCGGLK